MVGNFSGPCSSLEAGFRSLGLSVYHVRANSCVSVDFFWSGSIGACLARRFAGKYACCRLLLV